MNGSMYSKAAEYLKPIQKLSKLCGIFPYRSSSDSAIPKFNLIYPLLLLLLTALVLSRSLAIDLRFSKDIVSFTFILTAAISFLFHTAAVVIPLLLGKTYSKLLRRLEQAEVLIHRLNISQKQSTTIPFNILIVVCFAVVVFHFYILFSVAEASPIDTAGYIGLFITLSVCLCHLLTLLHFVKRKFASINWHLHYLSNKVPVYLTPADMKVFIEKKIHAKDVMENFADCYEADGRRVTAHKIKTFNKIHFTLYSSCNLIAKYFSLQILFSVLLTAFKAITMFITIFATDLFKMPVQLALLCFVAQNFILVFCIANVFYKIQCEVRNTVNVTEML